MADQQPQEAATAAPTGERRGGFGRGRGRG
jgi:hypothetical protein